MAVANNPRTSTETLNRMRIDNAAAIVAVAAARHLQNRANP